VYSLRCIGRKKVDGLVIEQLLLFTQVSPAVHFECVQACFASPEHVREDDGFALSAKARS
jgi:hypothetical protein